MTEDSQWTPENPEALHHLQEALTEAREGAVSAREAGMKDTEAYEDDPAQASQMWKAGLRPQFAEDLKPGQVVAFVQTMFGFESWEPEHRRWQTTEIGDVSVEGDGTVRVSTRHAGVVDVDELAEVWATPVVQSGRKARKGDR